MKAVFFGPDFVTITKDDDENVEWRVLKPEIFATIMDFFNSGKLLALVNGQSSEIGSQGFSLNSLCQKIPLIRLRRSLPTSFSSGKSWTDQRSLWISENHILFSRGMIW